MYAASFDIPHAAVPACVVLSTFIILRKIDKSNIKNRRNNSFKLSAVRHGLSFAHQTLEIPGELFNSRIDGRVLHEAVDDVRRHRDCPHAVLNQFQNQFKKNLNQLLRKLQFNIKKNLLLYHRKSLIKNIV